jgi:hypothetical protein
MSLVKSGIRPGEGVVKGPPSLRRFGSFTGAGTTPQQLEETMPILQGWRWSSNGQLKRFLYHMLHCRIGANLEKYYLQMFSKDRI